MFHSKLSLSYIDYEIYTYMTANGRITLYSVFRFQTTEELTYAAHCFSFLDAWYKLDKVNLTLLNNKRWECCECNVKPRIEIDVRCISEILALERFSAAEVIF